MEACVYEQELDYKHDAVLGIATTWPQMAAPVPSQNDWFDWEGDRPLNIPLDQLIIYELHVRGFTQHPSANASAPGTASCNHSFHITHNGCDPVPASMSLQPLLSASQHSAQPMVSTFSCMQAG